MCLSTSFDQQKSWGTFFSWQWQKLMVEVNGIPKVNGTPKTLAFKMPLKIGTLTCAIKF